MLARSAVFFIVALTTGQTLGWNALGHKVIAEIAWRQIDRPTRNTIVDAIRRNPRFDADFVSQMDDDAAKGDRATQDQWIFQQAATWPDIIRGNKEYDKPVWHYIDLPVFLDTSDRTAFAGRLPVNVSMEYPTTLAPDKFNVVQAIGYCRETIRGNASPEIKGVAYCWLFHLVGDMHQPLHCSALFSVDHLPKGDKGGNLIRMDRGRNLHSLWDGLMGRDSRMSSVNKAINELSNKRRFGDIWESAGSDTDPRKWADEGHALSESIVYDATILEAVRNAPAGQAPDKVELPEAYYKAAGDVARKRVLTAGLRLGAILNERGK
jgi:hypothetical protein